MQSQSDIKLADLLEPMPGLVAVQVKTTDEITPQGLYIPTDSVRTIHESRATQGIVVAIGTEDLAEPELNFKLGEVVVFGKYSGTEISYQPPSPDDDNPDIPHYKKRPRPPKEKIIIMTVKSILSRVKIASHAKNIKVKG